MAAGWHARARAARAPRLCYHLGMADAVRVEDLLSLGVDERLRLVEVLWDSLIAHPESIGVTDAQRRVIDERLREHEADPQDVIPWSELKTQLRVR